MKDLRDQTYLDYPVGKYCTVDMHLLTVDMHLLVVNMHLRVVHIVNMGQ
jgi:hypothetical protein